MREPIEQALFSTREASQFMGISESSVRNLLERGEIPSVTIAGCLRIRKQDIIDVINQRLVFKNEESF
jgi:excisionase family DNA binding protein